MRRPLVLLLLLAACNKPPERVDTAVEEWRLVLHAKKAAVKADDPATRQQYAAKLLAFVQKHPDHARAREVYNTLELDFARELTARGNYDQALRYLRDVESRDPKNRRLRRQLDETLDLQTVDATELAAVKPGMYEADVRTTIGPPPNGWMHRAATGRNVSWFYRNANGGVAAIHFENGRVIAVDYSSRM